MGLLIRILSPGKIREAYLREAVEQARLALQRQLQASGGRVELVEVEDSPDNWVCPVCGVSKDEFVPYED